MIGVLGLTLWSFGFLIASKGWRTQDFRTVWVGFAMAGVGVLLIVIQRAFDSYDERTEALKQRNRD